MVQTDVEDIKFVINFDYPNSSEDYVYRIGRTARASNTRTAYTFFTQNNCKQAVDLINVLPEANQQINPKLIQVGESPRFLGKDKSCRKLYLKVSSLSVRRNKPSFTQSVHTSVLHPTFGVNLTTGVPIFNCMHIVRDHKRQAKLILFTLAGCSRHSCH